MLKIMLIMSTLLQTFTSIVGNERGEVLTAEQIAANEAKVLEETKMKEAAELKATNKTEALRELSKELGINAFEPEELKNKFNEFTTWQTNQKSEQEKLQEQVNLYETEKTTWGKEKANLNSKLKASELGIPQDKLEDALKLAGGNPEALAEVVKKYPIFVSKDGIKIGVTLPNDKQDMSGLSEQDKYMEKWKGSRYVHKK